MGSRVDKIILLLLLFTTHIGFSQNISGSVTDVEGEPLPFVTVKIVGKNKGTITNLEGFYELEISKGGDSLSFSFMSFKTQTIFTKPGELNISLEDDTKKLEEVIIVHERKTEGEISLIFDKKNSMEVESSIGSEEMTKKGISDVEEGLKKVSGITFNSKKINVRGLDDRYNQVTLNTIPLPSNNADIKNLDLGLLPKSIVGNVKVKKSYSSNQWSNLAGSQIDITTSFLSDVNSIKVGLGTNTNGYLPTQNFGITIGRENVKKLGFLFVLNQSLSKQTIDGSTRLFNKQGNNILDYDYTNEITNIDISSMLIGKYRLKNLTFNSVTLLINSNNLEDKVNDGTHFDYGLPLRTWRRSPSRHSLFNQQILLDFKKDNFNLDGIISYSQTNSGEVNRNQLVYLFDDGYYFNNIDKIDNHHFSNQNKESRINTSVSTSYDLDWITPELGYSHSLTNNEFDYQQDYYDLSNVNDIYTTIDTDNPYQYIDGNATVYTINNPSSYVKGYTNIHAIYYKNDVNLKNINLSTGLRTEIVQQMVEFRDPVTPIFMRKYYLNNFELLPYLNLKYEINDNQQIKLSSSITTVRPRFREMTPFIYTEVFAGNKIQGNPELVNSKIYNFDLSYETYPKIGEMISITLFGKWIDKPIERINTATASGRLETYQNSDFGYSFGAEIEFKKKINKFTLDYNLSLLYSRIKINDNNNSSVIVTNFDRELQGSTPVLSNLDIFYKIKDNINLGLTYNLMGSKLHSVGVLGLGDVYQQTQHLVNLVGNYSIKKFIFNFRINNILNTKMRRTQNTEIGDVTNEEYRLPTQFNLGVKFNF